MSSLAYKIEKMAKQMGKNVTVEIMYQQKILCDICNEDFSNNDEKGGILFQSKAVCPHCTFQIEESLFRYGEERFIRKRAKKNQSFRDFVIEIRDRKD